MRLSFLCLFAAACFAVLCKIAAHPTGCRVSGCDCPATQEDCALAGQSTRDVCFCEHLVGHHRNRSARVTGSSGSSASASSSFAVVQPASVEPVDSQPDHPLPLSADQPSNDEPAGAAASDVGTAPLPDDSDIIDVDDTSRDAEPSTPPTAAAAASSTGAVSGRRRRQREDPPSDDSDDEDFLPALSRSRSTSNRKKAKQGRKVKSSDGHCVHERIMNCPRCGLNFALEVRGSGNRETATIMATFPPGLYESGNGSGSSSSAGGNGHGARAAASLGVGLAASAAAAAAGVAALSAHNRRNSFGATSTPPRSSSADGINSTPSRTPTRSGPWEPRHGSVMLRLCFHRRQCEAESLAGDLVDEPPLPDVAIVIGDTVDLSGKLGYFASYVNEVNEGDGGAIRAKLSVGPPPTIWGLRRVPYGRYTRYWIFPFPQFVERLQAHFPAIGSYDEMTQRSSNWTRELVLNVTNAGPTAADQMDTLLRMEAGATIPGAGMP